MGGRCWFAVALTWALAGWLVPAGIAHGGELGVSADLAVVSQYVWRGIRFDDKPSFQPTVTLEYCPAEAWSLAVTGWWNLALDDHDSSTHKDLLFEQDFTVTAGFQPDRAWSWSVGYNYYSNPRSDVEPGTTSWQTDEVFAGCSWTTGKFTHTATINVDVDRVRGVYLDLSTGPEVSLGQTLTVSPRLHLGVTSGMRPEDDEDGWYTRDGLVDGSLGAALSWTLGEHLEAGASLAVSKRFDDFHDETGDPDTYVTGGVLLRASF